MLPKRSISKISYPPDAIDKRLLVIVSAGALMNGGLAFVNAHAFGVNQTLVVATQAIITFAGVIVAYKRATVTISAVACVCVLAALAILAGSLHGAAPKNLYDLFAIPCFIFMGTALRSFPVRIFLCLFGLVVATTLIDVFAVEVYAAIFEPLQYFVNTRDWVANYVSGNEDSGLGLYVGAERGGGIFFSFLTDHRAGGVFLEPLSLSYFSAICAIFYAIYYRDSFIHRTIAFAACVILALFADSRVPTFLIMVFYCLSFFQAHIRKIHVVCAPLLPLCAALFYYIIKGDQVGGSETTYRIALTFGEMADTPLVNLILGVLNFGAPFGDSGVLYLIFIATLPGAVIALLLYSGAFSLTNNTQMVVPLMAGIYIGTTAMFGGAFLSIKSAGLMGILVGAASLGNLPIWKSTRHATHRNSVVRQTMATDVKVL